MNQIEIVTYNQTLRMSQILMLKLGSVCAVDEAYDQFPELAPIWICVSGAPTLRDHNIIVGDSIPVVGRFPMLVHDVSTARLD